MHERSPKNNNLDTVLYEIDMLRHCATTLRDKKGRAETLASSFITAEYYLGIEGLLLHLRNIIAFFTNRRDEPTDLIINAPDQWAGKPIDQREYSDLIKGIRDIDRKYGTEHSTCYDQISKYLQHCTTFRAERARNWDIEGIFNELNPFLEQFLVRFVAPRLPVRELAITNGNSTATLSKTVRFDDWFS